MIGILWVLVTVHIADSWLQLQRYYADRPGWRQGDGIVVLFTNYTPQYISDHKSTPLQ